MSCQEEACSYITTDAGSWSDSKDRIACA